MIGTQFPSRQRDDLGNRSLPIPDQQLLALARTCLRYRLNALFSATMFTIRISRHPWWLQLPSWTAASTRSAERWAPCSLWAVPFAFAVRTSDRSSEGGNPRTGAPFSCGGIPKQISLDMCNMVIYITVNDPGKRQYEPTSTSAN